jgi:hypothetical protein
MHTKDKLADALTQLGLIEMAAKARGGFYHDFLSPLPTPELQLISDLGAAASRLHDRSDAIMALRQRVIDGNFDASEEESEAWANSADGQEAFRRFSED